MEVKKLLHFQLPTSYFLVLSSNFPLHFVTCNLLSEPLAHSFKKILIIQTAFLGDVILASPLIEKLHQFFPEARLDFLLRKGNESLLSNHPYLNRVLILDKKRKSGSLIENIKQIRKERYDLVVNVQRFASSGIITCLSGARQTVGFSKNPFSIFFS